MQLQADIQDPEMMTLSKPQRSSGRRRRIPADIVNRVECTMSSVSALLNCAVRQAQVPGLVAMAANSESLIYSGAHGRRAESRSARMTTDTVFRLSSLVRPIIAVAALRAVDSGAMFLNSRMAASTIRERILRIADAREPVSNREIVALTHAIERGSGYRLEDYVHRQIFDPLGMTDTHFAAPASLWRRMADIQHPVAPGTFQSISRITVDPYALGSCRSALYSTPLDSMKFMRALLRADTRLLSARSHQELAAIQRPYVSPTHPLTYVGAFNTHVWIDKASETTGLLYTQLFPHNHPKITALFAEFQTMVLADSRWPHTTGAA
jgi:CubicO group peptidase (beta-lactamase class C family)